MTRWQRRCMTAVSISVAVGIMFGVLPRNWIELRLGIEPDGGSGLLELLFASIPIAAAAPVAIFMWRASRRAN
jgi:hypothetical protein